MDLVKISFSLDISDLLTSVIGLIGVLVGAVIAAKSASRQEHRRLLSEFYAALLTAYAEFACDPSSERISRVIVCCERVKLLCSEESYILVQRLENAMISKPIDPSEATSAFLLVKKQARKETGRKFPPL